MLFQYIWTSEFSVESIWYSQRGKTTAMSPDNCTVVFKLEKINSLFFSLHLIHNCCHFSIYANTQNIVSSISQSFSNTT